MNLTKVFKPLMASFVAILLATGMIACGGSDSASSSSGKVTVTYMTWETAQTNANLDAAMQTFMKQNPNIIVRHIASPNSNYGQKLSSLVVAKKLPDLLWAGNDTEQQYGAEGLLYDYSSLLSSSSSTLNPEQFAPASLENWKVNGKLYGLPSLMNTYGVWYNTDLFKAAHLPLPAAGWSYNDMLHDAQVLTQKNGNSVTRYGLWSPPDDPFSLGDYSVSAGGAPFEDSIVNPKFVTASPQFIEGTKLFANAVQQGYVTPPTYDVSNSTEGFASGKIPMLWGGQWLAASFMQSKPSFQYGFAPMPIVSKQVQPYDAVGIVSPSYIQHPDAVWKVMQFLDSTVWESVLPNSPVAPTAYQPAAQPYYSALKNAGLSSVVDSVQYELNTQDKLGIRFTAPWATKANDIVTANWNNILMGKTPVESGVQNMIQQINTTIQQGA